MVFTRLLTQLQWHSGWNWKHECSLTQCLSGICAGEPQTLGRGWNCWGSLAPVSVSMWFLYLVFSWGLFSMGTSHMVAQRYKAHFSRQKSRKKLYSLLWPSLESMQGTQFAPSSLLLGVITKANLKGEGSRLSLLMFGREKTGSRRAHCPGVIAIVIL